MVKNIYLNLIIEKTNQLKRMCNQANMYIFKNVFRSFYLFKIFFEKLTIKVKEGFEISQSIKYLT